MRLWLRVTVTAGESPPLSRAVAKRPRSEAEGIADGGSEAGRRPGEGHPIANENVVVWYVMRPSTTPIVSFPSVMESVAFAAVQLN